MARPSEKAKEEGVIPPTMMLPVEGARRRGMLHMRRAIDYSVNVLLEAGNGHLMLVVEDGRIKNLTVEPRRSAEASQ